jgi:enamine deaminase RidA (YjgF/YER057c/UK114 family)
MSSNSVRGGAADAFAGEAAGAAASGERRGQRRFISSGSPWETLAGYSRAVVDGDWIFVSGTVGQDFETMSLPESAQAQAEKALDTIEAALGQVPASLLDVVRVRVYAPERGDVPAISEVIKRRLGAARATNTTVCCPLAVEGAKVEIEVTARLTSREEIPAAGG